MQPQFITISPRVHDLTGQHFHWLTVLGPVGRTKTGAVRWLCRCECGTITTVRGSHLVHNETKSCGCRKKELVGQSKRKHGMFGSEIYHTWRCMLARCNYSKDKEYSRYNAHGITVCREWTDSFQMFHDHVSQLPNFGEKGYTLDRINNSTGYFPGNVRWVMSTEQARNRRDNVMLTYDGKTQCLSAWAEELGIKADTLSARIKRGWPLEKALFAPVAPTPAQSQAPYSATSSCPGS